MFCVFTFCSFRLATNDSVMSLMEPDCGVMWLKYEEPGSATMLMCSSVRVFLWYLFSTPRTCVSLILSTTKEYYLYARVVKLVTIQLKFLTIFPAFSADLASIDYFRPVDRRHDRAELMLLIQQLIYRRPVRRKFYSIKKMEML